MIRKGDTVTVDCTASHYHGCQGVVQEGPDRSGHWLVRLPHGGATCRLAKYLKLDPITALSRIVE